MKVYIISEVVIHEGSTIRAVFLDEEKARERLAKLEKHIPVVKGTDRKSVWYELTEYDVEESK